MFDKLRQYCGATSPTDVLVHPSVNLFRHVGKAGGGDKISADRVRMSRGGIEATRDQDNIGIELSRHRHDHAPV